MPPPHLLRFSSPCQTSSAVTGATSHITPYSGSSVAMAAITPCLPNPQWIASLKRRNGDRFSSLNSFMVRWWLMLLTFMLIKVRSHNNRSWKLLEAFWYSIKRFLHNQTFFYNRQVVYHPVWLHITKVSTAKIKSLILFKYNICIFVM